MKKLTLSVLILVRLATMQGCSLAPEYHPPFMDIPPTYQEAGKWISAKESRIDHGKWWEIYHDPVLNQLEEEVTHCNQDLKAALWRYENARAAVMVAESGYYPNFTAMADVNRQQTSVNIANPSTNRRYNDRLLGVDLSYELDVWGRVRNTVASAKHFAKASEADLAAADLSLHALLASNYFSMQGAKVSVQALEELVNAYEKALALTLYRFEGGAAPEVDVDQAKTQLENAKTLTTDMRLKLAQFEHAVAVLTGKVPSAFSMPCGEEHAVLPTITPILPSTLLQRRPDIASAEQHVMAANAEIGVARAAFFPDINLIGDIGVESASFRNLLGMPSLFWSLGPTLAQTLFDGGKISGQLAQARASYYETVANYRQTVLNAFQEVEDNLAAQRLLAKETISQTEATAAAKRALIQSVHRYEGGLTTYLDVVVAQNTYLQAKLASIDLNTRRQIASVTLIKALGGGWCDSNSQQESLTG